MKPTSEMMMEQEPSGRKRFTSIIRKTVIRLIKKSTSLRLPGMKHRQIQKLTKPTKTVLVK